MNENNLQEIAYEEGEQKIHLRKTENKIIGVPLNAGGPAIAQEPGIPKELLSQEEGLMEIKSPLVGTFYEAPKPGAELFVQPGDPVEADKVVCVIEAMKVMNEIKSEVNGVIEKIMVKNGQPVEFGQVLFLVRKK